MDTHIGYSDAGIPFPFHMNQDFCLIRGDGSVRVYRRRNERYADWCVLERDCGVVVCLGLFVVGFFFLGGVGGGRRFCHVWAAVAHGYRSPLVVIEGNLNAQRYRDDILAHHVIPLFHNKANISIFQHDNATSHTARDTVNFLRTNNIDFNDDWPANSPDLNPIEYVWDSLDRRLRCCPNPPLTSTNFVRRSFRNGTIFHRQKSTL